MLLSIEVKDLLTNNTRFYSLDKEEICFGRSPDQDIPVSNKYASGDHATLRVKKDGIFLRDEKSSNGTTLYKNSRWSRLESKWTKVKLPLQIRLADVVVISIQSGESQIMSLPETDKHAAMMVLDICNSTGQAVKNEQLAYHMKNRLNQITRPILYASPMEFYKNTGDGFLATFPNSTQAVKTAIEVLKTLERRNSRSKNPPINVRVALHVGATYRIDPITEDLHGSDINITFRIDGLRKTSFKPLENDPGVKNRLLTSEAFYLDFKKKTRRKNDIFAFCGQAKLKGIKERMPVYRINWEI